MIAFVLGAIKCWRCLGKGFIKTRVWPWIMTCPNEHCPHRKEK